VNISIELPAGLWERLKAHLLPKNAREEQAAFLFAAASVPADELRLRAIGSYMLTPSDFDAQHTDYLEITDECKSRLIQHAHQHQLSLVELHSHPGPWRAAFSPYDLRGLDDTVPHMLWRLKGRPYAAIVVAHTGFDAMVWTGKGEPACALTALVADGRRLLPTNLTLMR
jgi:hypothetical protein